MNYVVIKLKNTKYIKRSLEVEKMNYNSTRCGVIMLIDYFVIFFNDLWCYS